MSSFKLSPQQKRLWQLYQNGMDKMARCQCSIRIDGDLDVTKLRSVLAELAGQFEILRTTFRCPQGVTIPLQVVEDEVEIPIAEHDLRGSPPGQQEARLMELQQAILGEPFNLKQGPLLRFDLVRCAINQHRLLLSASPLCLDKASLNHILQHICSGYGARGTKSASAEVIQYPDFSEWQSSLLSSEDSEPGIKFWQKQQIAGASATGLTGRIFNAESFQCRLKFGPELKEACRRLQVTPRLLLQAGWQVLLSRITGETRITVGVEHDGRNYEELNGAVGLIGKTLPVQQKFERGMTGSELLVQTRGFSEEIQKQQEYYNWEELAQGGEAKINGVAFFPFGFSYTEMPEEQVVGGVTFEMAQLDFCAEPHELRLNCVEKKDGLMVEMQYDPGHFSEKNIRRISASLQMVLDGLTAAPEVEVAKLEILGDEERRWLLEEFNATQRNVPACPVHELFEAQVEQSPEAVAVAFGKEALTYRELNTRANQLAHYLGSLGVGPEVRAGIYLERSVEMMVGILGVLKAGGAYVPLDLQHPQKRVAFIIEDAGISAVLTHKKFLGRLSESKAQIISLDAHPLENGFSKIHANPRSEVRGENLAYVLYTSGSTGTPKGVMIPHKGLTNYLSWCREAYGRSGGEGTLVHSSIGFDLTITGLLLPLLLGQPVRLAPEGEGVEVLERAFTGIRDLSLIKITPAHLAVLEQMVPAQEVAGLSRAFVIGGEALQGESLKFWRTHAPATRLINEYGPTETVVGCCVYEVGSQDPAGGAVPIGRPIANTQLYILDEHLSLRPAGVPGELYIGGAGLARGYGNRPDLTGEKFIPDPFSQKPGARLYRTGDKVRHLPDGNIEYLGRLDQQVKLRGFRVELGEIESVLMGHPAVREAVVLVRQDEGQQQLVGYVTAREEGSITVATLRDHLQGKLPEYMVPGFFVFLPELPLTPNGKVDRKALPAPDRQMAGREYVAARTSAEKILAEIWSKVLKLDRVGMHDNFFELGGDSILSIQIIARANEAGLKLTPRLLFEHQTIAGLATVARHGGEVRAEQGPVSGAVELTPIQDWFFERELKETHHFNQSVMLTVEGVEPAQVEQVVREMVRQHDALRLRYELGESGWRQTNAELEKQEIFTRVDLSGVAEAEQAERITTEAARLQGSLNLTQGPIVRVGWFDLGAGRPARLLIVIHHLAVDGVSWRILLDDLQKGCRSLQRGGMVESGHKTSSFQQWAARLREYANSEGVQKELEYWQGILSRTWGRLPVDGHGGPNTVASQNTVTQWLTEEETRALLQEVPEKYHTQINDVLLTALAQAHGRVTGQSELLLDLEGHGRENLFEELDVTRTVGWFTTQYPVRLELTRELEAGAALKSVKEQLRQIPERGIGYGLLRYLNAVGRGRLGKLASPEVSFNYLGQFDQVLEKDSFFGPALESGGATISGRNQRSHLLDIVGKIQGGRLAMSWTYGENMHRRKTVEALGNAFMQALRELIAHCQSEEAGGFTPSDFPLIRLSQQEVDKLGREVEDVYPLSPTQEGILFHTLYEPGEGMYCVHLHCVLKGKLQTKAFKQAWDEVVKRHPVFRTAFVWEGRERPYQVVHSRVDLPWDERDWRALSEAEQQEQFQDFLKKDHKRGFNLAQAPLMRCGLFQLAEDAWQFTWSSHHLLMDGWCLSLIFTDVLDCYERSCRGDVKPMDRATPYHEFIRWLQMQDLAQAESYWRETLKDFDSPTVIGTEPEPGLSNVEGGLDVGEIWRVLPRGLMEKLQALGREHHLTMNTIVQGAWAMLLSHYSGQNDVVFGVTVSGRPAELAGIEKMVGLFINTLPMRVRLEPELNLLSWLRRLQEQQVELGKYEYSPLVQVQGWSEVPRGTSLFESTFTFQNYPMEKSLREDRKEFQIRKIGFNETGNYSLMLVATGGAELGGRIKYDRRRFTDEKIQQLARHWEQLLAAMVACPEQRLSEFDLLSEAEREQLLVDWNQTEKEYPRDRFIHQLFEAQTRQSPEAVAIVYGEEKLTYQELNSQANQLAHHLRSLGVGPEVLVGICVERSSEMVVGLLAILKAGGAYVPLDPGYPLERLAFMLENAGVTVLLTQERLEERLPSHGAIVVYLDQDRNPSISESEMDLRNQVSEQNLAYMLYTSGSTGVPKGVMIPHGGLINYLNWCRQAYGVSGGNGSLVHSSLGFDLTITGLLLPLILGQTVRLAPEGEGVEILERAFAEAKELNLIKITPAHLEVLKQIIPSGEAAGLTKTFVIGGEALKEESLEFWRTHAPETRLINEYGPTETVVGCCVYEVGPEDPSTGAVPIGRPIANTQLYILNKHMVPVPVGVPGELYIGGAGVARGYGSRPDMTAERFLPDPFCQRPGARLYRTGDLCRYVPDGKIDYLGRIDHQVKLRGFRIELGEIESVLSRHPLVEQSVVVVREDHPGDKRLVAYVVGNQMTSDSVGELRDHLKEKLPEYMVPTAVVLLEGLPLTPNGKVNRKALPEPELGNEKAFVAPRSPDEELLAGIWQEVLKVERVSIHDNFFDLGGHSLLATQVISRVREVLGLELPLRDLFEAPTLAGFGERVSQARRSGRKLSGPALVRTGRNGALPLSFAQERLWFIDQLQPGSPVYNAPGAVRIQGELSAQVLEQSINEILRRHEVLRTRFELQKNRPVQVIAAEQAVSIEVISLARLPAAEQEEEVRRLARAEAQAPFDLARGPLLRVKLLQLSDQEHVLLYTMHHIISDGWSMGVLVRELGLLYEVYAQGKPSPLPELAIQYADYSVWQREWLTGEVLAGQLNYWKEHLSGVSTLQLPLDYPRPLVQSHHGARESVTIQPGVAAGLKTLSQQEGVTLFMTVLAGLQVLLSRYSGQEDIAIGSVIANRNRSETEELIGFFVNTLVLRGDVSGDPTVGELLHRVREMTLGAYEHQDLPFEKLVEELQPERDMSRSPLFQVMFEWLNAPDEGVELKGMTLQPVAGTEITTRFDLEFHVREHKEGLSGWVVYNRELFRAETIRQMVGHLERVLAGFITNPTQQLSELKLLSDAELEQLLASWNNAQAEYPREQCIHELFEAQVRQIPEAIAVVCGEEKLTYHELNTRANRLAHHLQNLGVGPEVLVGICLERSLEMIIGLLGILKAGGAYVPLDPGYPRERLAFMLKDAQLKVVLSERKLTGLLNDCPVPLVYLEEPVEGVKQNEANLPNRNRPENLAYVIYTSGSTGKPKGALVTHYNVMRLFQATEKWFHFGPQDVWTFFHSHAFDFSVWEIWGALLYGGRLVVVPYLVSRSPEAFHKLLSQEGVTVLNQTPSAFGQLQAVDQQLSAAGELALRAVIFGGEALNLQSLQPWFERRGDERPQLVNMYGITETTVHVTYRPLTRMDVSKGSVIGKAIDDLQLYILDSNRQPVPIGVGGELYVGGAGLGRGYLNRAELTAERFVPDPFSTKPGARLYRTGDLCRHLVDGEIEYLGRIDQQVKVRGFRIELGEIESVLSQHPQVEQNLVLVREDSPGDKRLVGYVVGHQMTTPSVGELKEYLRSRLPEYMVPSAMVFLDRLPLTPNGKVDRKALPVPERTGGDNDYVAPGSELEVQLAQIWAEVLGMERVGMTDDFFELGGHSLLATQLVSRVRESFEVELPLRSLFEAPRIMAMAELITWALKEREMENHKSADQEEGII